jgi:hypothetical protein
LTGVDDLSKRVVDFLTEVANPLTGVADSWAEVESFIDAVTGLTERVRYCLSEVDVPAHEVVNDGPGSGKPFDGVRDCFGGIT